MTVIDLLPAAAAARARVDAALKEAAEILAHAVVIREHAALVRDCLCREVDADVMESLFQRVIRR